MKSSLTFNAEVTQRNFVERGEAARRQRRGRTKYNRPSGGGPEVLQVSTAKNESQ